MEESMETGDAVVVEGVWLWAVDCRWSSEILAYEQSTRSTLPLLLLQILFSKDF